MSQPPASKNTVQFDEIASQKLCLELKLEKDLGVQISITKAINYIYNFSSLADKEKIIIQLKPDEKTKVKKAEEMVKKIMSPPCIDKMKNWA